MPTVLKPRPPELLRDRTELRAFELGRFCMKAELSLATLAAALLVVELFALLA
jgi:hypothetical protein